jgi:hypothetical protein
MAKLTGAKKKAFLERMEKGRKKAARANPKRKAPKKKAAAKRTPAAAPKRKPAKTKPAQTRNPKWPKTSTRVWEIYKTDSGRTAELAHGDAKKDAVLGRWRKSGYKVAARLKKNPQKKRRRNNEATAEAMYETFHGKAPDHILTFEEQTDHREHYAELGKLLELRIDLDSANHKFPFTGFGDCLVVCTADGENIIFVGGDQSVDLENLEIASQKDLLELGPCVYIAYRTEKHQFHDFTPRPYYHLFGEENGIKPMLCYDRLNRRLYFTGGDYHVKRAGITN